MSTENLPYILISPLEEGIVREAILLSLILDEKPVHCSIPTWHSDDVTTLKLIPWISEEEDLVNISDTVFPPSNIEVFKRTWPAVPDLNCEEVFIMIISNMTLKGLITALHQQRKGILRL